MLRHAVRGGSSYEQHYPNFHSNASNTLADLLRREAAPNLRRPPEQDRLPLLPHARQAASLIGLAFAPSRPYHLDNRKKGGKRCPRVPIFWSGRWRTRASTASLVSQA